MDPLAKGLREAVVASGVDINPAPLGVMRFARDEQHLAARDAGVTHQVSPRLDKQPRGLAKRKCTAIALSIASA